MSCDAVLQARDKLIAAEMATVDSLVECTAADIAAIEHRFAIKLPGCYVYFLETMGRDPASFLSGTDFTFPELLDFREQAKELLIYDAIDFALPTDAFVVLFHGGYVFAFLHCNDGDDPPIYLYEQGVPQPRKVADSFSLWLHMLVDDDIAIERPFKGTLV